MLSGSHVVRGEAPRPLHHPSATGALARPAAADDLPPAGHLTRLRPPPRSGEDQGKAQHRTVGASKANVERARELRKEMTLPEVLLWRELRGKPLGLRFRKQFPLLGYVIDFACLEVRLLVEIDGIAHDMGDRPARDQKRDAVLMGKGWRIVRIPASDVLKDPGAIASAIVALADSRSDEDDFV